MSKAMTKFEYKVKKAFSLNPDGSGTKKVADIDRQKRRGIEFEEAAMYVDYECEKNKIKQDPITQTLVSSKHIELLGQKTI